jgi:hypothetical protein
LSRKLRSLLVVLPALPGLVVPAVQASAAPAGVVFVCYQGYYQNVGWDPTIACNNPGGGGTWLERADRAHLEAINVSMIGAGSYIVQGHSQDIGWGPRVPGDDNHTVTVGTMGLNKRLEKIYIESSSYLCIQTSWEGGGDYTPSCGYYISSGTTGQGRGLTGIEIFQK